MTWLLFALASVVTLSFSNILQRVLMKDEQSDAVAYSIVFQLMGAVIIGIFAFWKGFTPPPLGELWLNFLLLALLYGLGTLALFKALQLIEASETTILVTTRSIVTIISAIILLHDTFSFMRIVGVGLILFAILFITDRKKHFQFNKGVLYALFSALCYGLAVTNDAFILKHMSDVLSFTAVSFLLPGLFLTLIHFKSLAKVKIFLQPIIFRNMFVMTFLYSLAAIAFYSAIQYGAQASQISPVNQSSVIMTVLLAAIFLGEKDYLLKKFISAVLVLAGVLLLR